jgi:8-oxo-dGTP pyrophosphatase MutT (NUDIX family)
MLRRDSKLAFAGGMWVFPGGRVDPDDYEGSDDVLAAARRAAVREAAEEAGLAVDPASLVWLSHWTPPPQTPRRFATWFFVAPAPTGDVMIDDGEIRDHMWVAPADAIARRDVLEIELAPPTWVTLHTLARSATVAEALRAARDAEIEYFTTKAAMTEEGVVALWAGDAGYGTGDASVLGPRHRLWMVESGWRYERD